MLKQTLKYDLSNLENILFDSYKFTAKELANHYIDLIYSSDKHIKAFNEFPKNLLSIEKDSKTSKSTNIENKLTAIQYLYPTKQSCVYAKIGNCFKGCLKDSGNSLIFQNVNLYRLRKALFKMQYQIEYLNLLKKDIDKFLLQCKKRNLEPCIRLNGITDYSFENDFLIFNEIIKPYTNKHNVKFYDYTKNANRNTQGYIDLTFSYSNEKRYQKYVDIALNKGMRIAVVFKDKDTLEYYQKHNFLNRKVIDGDKNDLTFLHSNDVILGLIAKGNLKKDNDNNFIVTKP
tara:strand:+ start:241 stop:1104 length:864 start_codon:yes stop_codon:yes gene_type:complete